MKFSEHILSKPPVGLQTNLRLRATHSTVAPLFGAQGVIKQMTNSHSLSLLPKHRQKHSSFLLFLFSSSLSFSLFSFPLSLPYIPCIFLFLSLTTSLFPSLSSHSHSLPQVHYPTSSSLSLSLALSLSFSLALNHTIHLSLTLDCVPFRIYCVSICELPRGVRCPVGLHL